MLGDDLAVFDFGFVDAAHELQDARERDARGDVLGIALQRFGERDVRFLDAAEDVERMAKIEPGRSALRSELGALAECDHRAVEILKLGERRAEIVPRQRIVRTLGDDAFQHHGRFAEAVAQMRNDRAHAQNFRMRRR